ncbi:MAG TPA: DUF503 domain-containing protein [Thermoanaerobaculia bacterium]|jgi:hypothetical protein|nr:DUF503 domain-containing protein [Thermoanaerobaculia bacterium]
MFVAISIFELHLPECRSLKGKRKVIKGMIERIHHRFRVSIAETDFHDLHQRSEIAVAVVSRSESELDRILAGIRDLVDAVAPEAFLTRWEPQILEAER